MKVKTTLSVLCIISVLCACTTIPDRFTVEPGAEFWSGYYVEAEDAEGIDLQVYYKAASWTGNADDDLEQAKDYFKEVAKRLAGKRGKQTKAISSSGLNSSSSYNWWDGMLAIHVSGRVSYVPQK